MSITIATDGPASTNDLRVLEHDLDAEFGWMSTFRSHAALERHPAFPRIAPELDRVLHGFAWDLRCPQPPRSPEHIQAVAWNIERGKRFDVMLEHIAAHPRLANADLLLLNEVDIGQGRSHNRHVPAELARALGHAWVFANSHLVLSPGDAGERYHGHPNRDGLHGNAILTRFPVLRVDAVTLPEYRDKLAAVEQRLGHKRALLVELDVPGGPLVVANVHLDPFAPARYRALQANLVLAAINRFIRGGGRDPAHAPVLFGGDLNTVTYDLSSPVGLAAGLIEKGLTVGVSGAIEHYMTPELRYERPLFEAMAAGGFSMEGFNDRSHGTLHFDANDPELIEKATHYMPLSLFERLARTLDRWDRRVPMRLDWFFGRNLRPRCAHVLAQSPSRAAQASDHDPIAVELEPLSTARA